MGKRAPYECNKCLKPLKGHVCPYKPSKSNLRIDTTKKETKDMQIQTDEESFLYQRAKMMNRQTRILDMSDQEQQGDQQAAAGREQGGEEKRKNSDSRIDGIVAD